MSSTDREELKAKNLEAIRQVLPPLADALGGHMPPSKLVISESGEADVLVDGTGVYQGNASRFAAEQAEMFRAKGLSIALPKPEPGAFDEHTNHFLLALARRTAEQGIQFVDQPGTSDAYYLIVSGIGLGYHLDAVIEESGAQFVILVDKDIDFLRHSLEVYDWTALIGSMAAQGRRIAFAIDPNPQSLSWAIANMIKDWNPVSVDGTRVFIHSGEDMISRMLNFFHSDMSKVLSYMGYFNDELIMLRNAYHSLKSGKSQVYLRPEKANIKAPVFLIASGPSLDESIPFIHDNADKAVIISNGSALHPLLVNGIVPDFHIETENVFVAPVVELAAKNFDLSKICLVASSTVDQHITEHFGKVIYFFRSALSAFPLFCDSERRCLLRPDPTVVNAGLSFLQETGFTRAYFFGIDLGTKGAGRHHSKDAYHYSEGAIPESKRYDIPVPGNFGGQVLSALDFAFTRVNMAEAIHYHGPAIKYFNCSDGALIEGAQPQVTGELSFAKISGGKKKVVKGIIECFPAYTLDSFNEAWDPDKIFAAFNDLTDRFVESFAGRTSFQDRAEFVRATIELRPLMYIGAVLEKRFDGTAFRVFRGTLIMMMGAVEFYAQRLSDPTKHAAFATIVREEIAACAERIRDLAIETLSDPTVVPAITNQGAAAPDGVIPEVAASWGQVSRNEPCPCGSGKRYKHCHGSTA